MTIHELNCLPITEAHEVLTRCCGASRWAAEVIALRPLVDINAVHSAADAIWAMMDRTDILEAFSHHPQIGADLVSLRQKFARTANWSAGEQAGLQAADEVTLLGLVEGNREYLTKFGHIFIVCASGKSAAEMLALLQARLANDPDTELKIAAAEQAQIMHLRLDKLFESI